MRSIHMLPLAAAIVLAACGDSGDADADGDGKLSAEEVAAEAEGLVQPRPGLYRSNVELLELEAPDLPPGAKEQMQQIMAGASGAGSTFCMTEQEAAENGAEQMVKNLARSDCTMTSFNVSGGTVAADMQCAGEGGAKNHVVMQGQMSAEGSTMTMDMDGAGPDGSPMSMKMRVTSERVGDCPA